MKTNDIKSVTIGMPVKKITEATNWYRKLFPDREEATPMEGIWEILIMPSVWLQLFESDAKENSSKSINLETNDILLSRKLVMSLGVKAGEIEIVPNIIQYFEFSDPFGNNFSFIQLLSKKD
jgi:hypothetical protein